MTFFKCNKDDKIIILRFVFTIIEAISTNKNSIQTPKKIRGMREQWVRRGEGVGLT